jgi:hypothetical protein
VLERDCRGIRGEGLARDGSSMSREKSVISSFEEKERNAVRVRVPFDFDG